MEIADAQWEVRSTAIGGFWGQLLYSLLYLASAAVGTWSTPRRSILTLVVGGFFVFPVMQMILRVSGCPGRVSRDNPFHLLCMQIAFALPISMLLLIPVGLYRLNWFFPALMVLLGAHYLPFASSFGMRMFLFLAAILVAAGVVIALYFSRAFSLGAWFTGMTLFVFAWIGRYIAISEARAQLAVSIQH